MESLVRRPVGTFQTVRRKGGIIALKFYTKNIIVYDKMNFLQNRCAFILQLPPKKRFRNSLWTEITGICASLKGG